jgi:diguanylate cyclase (GGDEF)-like protein/PAS domain S-box-containing protein
VDLPLKATIAHRRKRPGEHGHKKAASQGSFGGSSGARPENQLIGQAFEQCAIGMALVGLDGKWIRVNPALCRILGYSEQELLATNFQDSPHPDNARLDPEYLRKMLKGEIRFCEMERRVFHKDGNVVQLALSISLIFDKAAKPCFFLFEIQDITEQRKTEENLRRSEESYRRLVELSPDGMLVRNKEGTIIFANGACAAMLGASSPAEIIGRQVLDFVHPDDQEAVKERIRTIRHGTGAARPPRSERRYIGLDGRQLDVEVVVNPMIYQSEPAAEVIMRDISRRKQAELKLQQANKELAANVEELQQRSKEITLLSEMGNWLQSCQTADEAFAVIGRSVQQLFPERAGALYILSASRNIVEAVAAWGESAGLERVFTPNDCWALRRGQPHRFKQDGTTNRCRHTAGAALLESQCMPLVAHGEALGVLHLQVPHAQADREEPALRSSAEAEQRLTSVLAEQIGLALANLRLKESLRTQSIRDALTGLFNRRYMEESLEREMSRANRNKKSLALVMMDIDRFKHFNDTFGHQAGDTLLRALGDWLKKRTRGQDIACRYGGEEFALVLSDSSLEAALQRSEILREEIKELSVQHAGQVLGTINLSMGVAVFPDDGLTVSEILRAADEALYHAKHEGRDRVCAWSSLARAK